ncbi:hypothetical protein, partial [Enterobacter cloacae complex sp. 2DZ2F20B]|uniref:hypothetical protein n=1 Tax=Enterobacter cloacae complex sp. 2DZ2F20B TaxID=2511993 RepID=UPI001CA47A4F
YFYCIFNEFLYTIKHKNDKSLYSQVFVIAPVMPNMQSGGREESTIVDYATVSLNIYIFTTSFQFSISTVLFYPVAQMHNRNKGLPNSNTPHIIHQSRWRTYPN